MKRGTRGTKSEIRNTWPILFLLFNYRIFYHQHPQYQVYILSLRTLFNTLSIYFLKSVSMLDTGNKAENTYLFYATRYLLIFVPLCQQYACYIPSVHARLLRQHLFFPFKFNSSSMIQSFFILSLFQCMCV